MANHLNLGLVLLIISMNVSFSKLQAQIYEVSLDQRIRESEFIFEGKVLESKCFWAPNHRTIYTSHLLKLDRVLAGEIAGKEVEIITLGGTIGENGQHYTHTLSLGPGSRGLFFCNRTKMPALPRATDSGIALDVYADIQGFIRYFNDGINPPAVDPFRRYFDISTELFMPIAASKGVPLAESWLNGTSPNPNQSTASISITDFYPDTVTAGTRTVLTIVGTEFGDSIGTVLFANADDGGATMMQGDSVDILYWSTDTIRVLVPSAGRFFDDSLKGTAGTGQIALKDASGNGAMSADTLWVKYAILNDRFNVTLDAYPIHLIDTNGLGGYTFQYAPSFRMNDSARIAFEWALRKWRCSTGVNFVIGSDTNIAGPPMNDEISTVQWTALSPGQLGRTVVHTKSCVSMLTVDLQYFATNIDFQFDSTQVYHFDTLTGPPLFAIDFPSVVLHEIGHAHLIDHVIERDSLMHYATSAGQSVRQISQSQLAAGDYVLDSINVAAPGCPSPMTTVQPLSCTNIQLLSVYPSNLAGHQLKVYPNPVTESTKVFVSIDRGTHMLHLSLQDLLGRNVQNLYCQKLGPGTHQLPLNFNHLSSGTYFLSGTLDGTFFAYKILK